MDSVTQDMRFRQSLLKYSEKYGVTKAAIKYKTNRQYIYRWKRRYDGTIESLRERSRRPHHHPNEHTEAEIKLIGDMRRRNPEAGLVVFWVKLMQRGYIRSITGLYRVLRRRGEMAVKPLTEIDLPDSDDDDFDEIPIDDKALLDILPPPPPEEKDERGKLKRELQEEVQ